MSMTGQQDGPVLPPLVVPPVIVRPATAGAVRVPIPIDELIDRLAAHRAIGQAPREELAWLASHGELQLVPPGVVMASATQPIESMYILLSGRMSIHLVRAGTRHKIAEWGPGDVSGLLPYSRLTTPPGDTIIEEPTEVFVVPRDQLNALARECHEITSVLVHVMLDRARFFNSTMLHDEKLKSLGKLAAGLAHELNNPAAAIVRFAKMLPEVVGAAEGAARAIGAAGLTGEEAESVTRLSQACRATQVREVRSPVQESEREEQMAGWLEAHHADPRDAEALARSPLTIEVLDRLAGAVRPEVLEAALRWVAQDASARNLAAEIDHAATRISDLVTAVRGFTRVDESAVPQAVDLAEGLSQTLAVLRGKARGKGVRMTIDVGPDVPRVTGVAAELNQVWANLIDNAIDAVPASGGVAVTVRCEQGLVVVRVVDDGPGIPPEIRGRIFDPFFTTKDVGKGTGLGLDIVRRLVDRHDGDIEVESRPGRTEFIVSLPPVAAGCDPASASDASRAGAPSGK